MSAEEQERIRQELFEVMSSGAMYIPVGMMSGATLDMFVAAAAARLPRLEAAATPQTRPFPLTASARRLLALVSGIGKAILHARGTSGPGRPSRRLHT